MVQVPKQHVRQALVSAALEEFAREGFEGTILATVAARANTSVGNLYKYFPGKEALFEAALPAKLVEELRSLLRARVEALGGTLDVNELAADHPYREASRKLLDFTIEHRFQLVFLLSHAQGTSYAGFSDTLSRDLVKLAVAYAKRAYPRLTLTTTERRALRRIYRAFVQSLADILIEEPRPSALREAVALHTSYHLPGLRSFFEAGLTSQRRRA